MIIFVLVPFSTCLAFLLLLGTFFVAFACAFRRHIFQIHFGTFFRYILAHFLYKFKYLGFWVLPVIVRPKLKNP